MNITSLKTNIIEIAFIFLLGLTPLLWFESGYLITSVDVDWPLSPTERVIERSSVWYPQFQSGTDRSINTSSLPYFFLPALFQSIGMDVITGEKLTYIFWLVLNGLAMHFLMAQIVVGNEAWVSVARLIAVMLYMYNFYLFFVWPRLQLAFGPIVLLPILLGVIIKRVDHNISYSRSAMIIGIFTILAAPMGIQPPLIGSIIIAITIYLILQISSKVVNRKYMEISNIVIFCSFLFIIIILFSMFWLLPLANFIIGSGYTSNNVGLEVYQVKKLLNWVSSCTNSINVLTNIADIMFYDSWGEEDYYPIFRLYRENSILITAKFVIPILAFSSLLIYRNYYVVYFSILSVVGILFSMGSYPPFGMIFTWLIENIPGFWIYRAPWQKFAILTTIGYSVLTGIACGKIYQRLEETTKNDEKNLSL